MTDLTHCRLGRNRATLCENLDKSEMSGIKRSLNIGAGAVICEECEIRGEVTIGAGTVIHPNAQIIAEAGPIVIGDNNLIEEQAQIINRQNSNPNQTVMIIGNNNVFEVGCISESLKIGDNNVLEAKARVGYQTELTDGCIIGAMCHVTGSEVIRENTVVFGSECQRRTQIDTQKPQTLQLEFLRKILPNYHYLIKTSKKPTKK